FEQFFRHVPPASGMAFVLIIHLNPGHASLMTEILQRTTVLPVAEAKDQMMVAQYSSPSSFSFTATPAGQPQRLEELEQELLDTKENLHATIEEAQATNE
ncbi:MAG: chemotaxis protein CheB, partial [Thermodesulfobacteriota bacterium]